VAAPEMPRVDLAADQALEPYDSYERFYLREYRGVVELAYALSGNRAGAEDIAKRGLRAPQHSWIPRR
jgi:hypothetical protein